MEFYINLREIINILECTNIELSQKAKLNQTIISKFKNNIRIPTIGSKSFESLVNGLCIIATNNNKIKQINALCGNNKNLYENIYAFLVNNSVNIRLNKEKDSLTGINLEKIMKTFNITNVMLSKHLNIDGSLISKYKTGKRYILKNDKLVVQLCDFFENHIIKNKLQEEAYTLFNIKNTNILKESIFNYLFSKQKEDSQINSLLESINNFSYNMTQNIPTIESLIPSEIIHSKKEYYIGTSDFRNSIKRLLSNTCLNDHQTTLYLYSDDNMKWLFQNKDFYNTWKILMMTCLIKKNNIKIVHNINRNPNEMFKAIESWLPLYMTGLIEPYYNLKNNSNFTHTIFISDNIGVISSSSIICNKDCNIYNYSTNQEIIRNYKTQYLELLNNSKNLLKIYTQNNIDVKLKNTNLYKKYTKNNIENIEIFIKKDSKEVLILKTNSPKILFEFSYSKMIDIFIEYVKL